MSEIEKLNAQYENSIVILRKENEELKAEVEDLKAHFQFTKFEENAKIIKKLKAENESMERQLLVNGIKIIEIIEIKQEKYPPACFCGACSPSKKFEIEQKMSKIEKLKAQYENFIVILSEEYEELKAKMQK